MSHPPPDFRRSLARISMLDLLIGAVAAVGVTVGFMAQVML